MFKWLVSLILGLATLGVIQAQTEGDGALYPFEQQQQVLWIGTSSNLVKQLDEGVSSLQYIGPGVGTSFGYASEKTKRRFEIWASTSYNLLVASPSSGGTYSTNNVMWNSRISYQFRLANASNYRLFIGPYFSTIGHANYNSSYMNASLHYDLLNSVGASIATKRTWMLPKGEKRLIGKKERRFDRYWTAEACLSIPAVSFGLRPPYAVLHHITSDELGDIDLNPFVGSYGTVLQLESFLGITYHTRPWNAWQLRYHYNAYRIDQGYNYFESFNSRLELSFVINLTRSLNE